MVDKTCRTCLTTKSSQWTRSKMIPGADLCTQCYRTETKIREGKMDMEQLKKDAGITELKKKSDEIDSEAKKVLQQCEARERKLNAEMEELKAEMIEQEKSFKLLKEKNKLHRT